MKSSGVDGRNDDGRRLIWLKPAAPLKPASGQPCNGCGVCCAVEPCPVARVFLWQMRGACRALIWREPEQQYRCGILLQPSSYLRYLPASWQPWFRRLIVRWIAAGTACDSEAEVQSGAEAETVAALEGEPPHHR